MDYESMMQWFEGREPYKLECIQRQAQYHSTYVGEYTFFYESYPPRYNWNIVESGVKHHIPTCMNFTTKVDENVWYFKINRPWDHPVWNIVVVRFQNGPCLNNIHFNKNDWQMKRQRSFRNSEEKWSETVCCTRYNIFQIYNWFFFLFLILNKSV